MLVRSSDFTAEELAVVGDGAGRIGLGVSVHEPGVRGGNIVAWLVVIPALLATDIAAIVGALHRAETAEVDVAYQSVGAPAPFRRKLHALTVAALVLIAAVLASLAGVLSQVGFATEQLGWDGLWRMIPAVPLLAVLVVVPTVAFAVNWIGATGERDAPVPQRQFG